MYVKTRHSFAGTAGHWEYDDRNWKSLAEAREMLCHRQFECGEHCRGIEIRVVRKLPVEFIKERVKWHRELAAIHRQRAADLAAIAAGG